MQQRLGHAEKQAFASETRGCVAAESLFVSLQVASGNKGELLSYRLLCNTGQ